MTNPLGHRRRATRFAQLLEEANGGRRQHLRTPYDDELTALVSVRQQLVNAAADPEIDPEFRTGLRAMLVATAEREGIGTAAQPAPAPVAVAVSRPSPITVAAQRLRTAFTDGPRARTAVIAGIAVGAVAFTGISTASENALPGDPLYGVKRSTERAQLALASSDIGRGQLYLDFAQTRLAEARTLSSDVDRVLADMDRDTSHGVRLLTIAATNRQDRAALDVIDGFVAEQRQALDEFGRNVPPAERSRVAASSALLDAIEDRASDLRNSLDRNCSSITSIDNLGPIPADCVALPPPTTLDFAPPPASPADADHSDQPPAATGQGAGADVDLAHPIGPQSWLGGPGDANGSEAGDEADADSAPADSEPVPSEDEGGLINGFNRIVGNLLGE